MTEPCEHQMLPDSIEIGIYSVEGPSSAGFIFCCSTMERSQTKGWAPIIESLAGLFCATSYSWPAHLPLRNGNTAALLRTARWPRSHPPAAYPTYFSPPLFYPSFNSLSFGLHFSQPLLLFVEESLFPFSVLFPLGSEST